MQPHRMRAIALPTPPSSLTAAFAIALLIVSSVPVLHYASFLLNSSHNIDHICGNDCKFKLGR